MPLKNTQKGAQTKTRTPRRYQDMGRYRIGLRGITTEEVRIPGMEARPPLGPEGIGPVVEAGGGGGVVQELAEEGCNQEGRTHRG